MKILITGAHFTPAHAVIEELVKRQSQSKIVYIGRKYLPTGEKILTAEAKVLPELGVKFIPIISGGLRRVLDINTFISLFKIPIGFVQSFYILVKEQPAVILSFGGYVSVPVVVGAWLLNIPIILHEQTLVPGLANRISSFFASIIAVSFAEEYGFKKEKVILTGNPIRKEILDPAKPSKELEVFLKNANKEKLPIIYITGGSQGSHIINKVISDILEGLTQIAFVVHQTGDSKYNDFDALSHKKESLKNKSRYLLQKWLLGDDVGNILKKADLVISRAGVNTLLEIAYFGIPAIVIPIPYLYKDEQNTNAKFFKKIGLCQVISQGSLSDQILFSKIKEVLQNIDKLQELAVLGKSLIIADAAKILAQETLVLGFKKEI